MDALSSLIRHADAGDPLARALGAVLESGLIVYTRDSGGRFVEMSGVLGERLGLGDERGERYPKELRYFYTSGRMLPVSEIPAQVVRTSGRARRGELNRLETASGRVWMQVSNLPLERTAEGWSVLTIGADVTELVDARDAAGRASEARAALLRLAGELAGRARVGFDEMRGLLRGPMSLVAPGANVLLTRQDGLEFEIKPVCHGFGQVPETRRAHLSAELRERWSAARAHVNLNVQETDIYGARVVAELASRFRSVVVAPCSSADRARIGGLVVNHPEANAFEAWQIESFELAGVLAGAAMYGSGASEVGRDAA